MVSFTVYPHRRYRDLPPLSVTSKKNSAMDKQEAGHIYNSGKKPTVTRLLEQDNQIKKLKAKIVSLSQDSSNSSKPKSEKGKHH